MQIAKELAGFSPAEAETLRKAIGKKIHALMASLKDKFLEGCAENARRAGGRAAALEGHGVVAGLLLQQGARRLLRAHRLPHGVAQGEPSEGVHGRAHLLGHEHEGPRAVLRERVPGDGDRRAPAGRQLVAAGLRGRRRRDPLRPERREERRGGGRRGDRPRARARAGRSSRSGSSPSASTRRSLNKRALESLVKCGALDSTGATRMGMLAGARRGARRTGSGIAADRLAGQASIFDGALRRGRGVRRGRTIRRSRRTRVRRARAPPAREGDARALRLGASARARSRRAPAQDGLRAHRPRAAARRRVRHRRRHRLRASSR